VWFSDVQRSDQAFSQETSQHPFGEGKGVVYIIPVLHKDSSSSSSHLLPIPLYAISPPESLAHHRYEPVLSLTSYTLIFVHLGASSALGYRLVLATIARRDLVIAVATTPEDITQLQSAGAYAIRVDSQMTYSQIKAKLQQAVEQCGKIDFLIHNSDVDSRRISRLMSLFSLIYQFD